jgi:hypothetical protein
VTTDLDLLFERLNLLQENCIENSDARPVAFYTQEAYPFWTCRVAAGQVELDSQDYQRVTYIIIMRLVLANFSEGIGTEAEARIAEVIPVVLEYFGRRRNLTLNSTQEVLDNLSPLGAVITDFVTLYGQLNTGIGTDQFGVEFTLEVPYQYQITQIVL